MGSPHRSTHKLRHQFHLPPILLNPAPIAFVPPSTCVHNCCTSFSLENLTTRSHHNKNHKLYSQGPIPCIVAHKILMNVTPPRYTSRTMDRFDWLNHCNGNDHEISSSLSKWYILWLRALISNDISYGSRNIKRKVN